MLPRFPFRCPDTCETCRFWQPDEDFEDNVLGECLLKAGVSSARLPAAVDPGTLAGPARRPWPLTESRDWCAEWRAA